MSKLKPDKTSAHLVFTSDFEVQETERHSGRPLLQGILRCLFHQWRISSGFRDMFEHADCGPRYCEMDIKDWRFLISGSPATTTGFFRGHFPSFSCLSFILSYFRCLPTNPKMRSLVSVGVALLGLSSRLVNGAALRAEPISQPASLVERNAEPNVVDLEQRQTCTHGPTNRGCWTSGFSINTDQYTSWPNTGRTVTVCTANLTTSQYLTLPSTI